MTPPTVIQALSSVMAAVQGIAKKDRNTQQNFNFRGIDAVINAVGPALRDHGVVVVPIAESLEVEHFTTAKGTSMRGVTVRCTWRFYGPAGDHIDAVTYGEAADAGDKATPKAMSVAYRTVLLQALCIPTDEPDPDAQSYDRAKPEPRLNDIKRAIVAEGDRLGWSVNDVSSDYAAARGSTIVGATVEQLTDYLAALKLLPTPEPVPA